MPTRHVLTGVWERPRRDWHARGNLGKSKSAPMWRRRRRASSCTIVRDHEQSFEVSRSSSPDTVSKHAGPETRRGRPGGRKASARGRAVSSCVCLEVLVAADKVVAHCARVAQVRHGLPVAVEGLDEARHDQTHKLVEADVVDGLGRVQALFSEARLDLDAVLAAVVLGVLGDGLKLASVGRDETLQRVAHKHDLGVMIQAMENPGRVKIS